MRPEDNRFALYASKYLEIKKVITECLFQNHDLRLTSVAIILDGLLIYCYYLQDISFQAAFIVGNHMSIPIGSDYKNDKFQNN